MLRNSLGQVDRQIELIKYEPLDQEKYSMTTCGDFLNKLDAQESKYDKPL